MDTVALIPVDAVNQKRQSQTAYRRPTAGQYDVLQKRVFFFFFSYFWFFYLFNIHIYIKIMGLCHLTPIISYPQLLYPTLTHFLYYCVFLFMHL